jgi:hypothetical protein
MNDDARALAPVTESTELTVADAADALQDFQSETGPIENRTPAVEEKKEAATPSDDTSVTLKDGTEVSLTELKRGYLSRRHFTLKTQALAQERARVEELGALIQNQSTQTHALREALDTVSAVLLPQQPDPSMIDVDPQAYKTQRENYEFVMGLIAHAQQTAQAEFNAAQAARQAEQRDINHRQLMAKQEQQDRLFEQMPELKNPNVSRQFQEAAIDTMSEYGYGVSELDVILNDVRTFQIVKDLIAYRRALKGVPKMKEKVASAPVLTGRKRMDRTERSNRANRTELEQFRNSGRLDDAAAILAKRMKD